MDFWNLAKDDKNCLRRYSLHFLASLFTTRFPGLTDGSIRCPLFYIADSGDGLFSQQYVEKVFKRLQAPHKELITFHFNDHMFMVTHPQEVCEKLTEIIRRQFSLREIEQAKGIPLNDSIFAL